MSFQVQHACPQCGAGIEFADSDRLLSCPYCGVRNFMYSAHYLRFMFQPQVTGDSVIFAPYLHFKGNVFFFRGLEIGHKHLEASPLGISSRVLPGNLGFKTQTQKLRVVSGEERGTFLRFDAKPTEVLSASLTAAVGEGTSNHAYIGEVLSLVYFPMVLRASMLVDGITGDVLAQVPKGFDFSEHALAEPPSSNLNFLATLCPHCGAGMHGEGMSLALVCTTCDSVWEPVRGALVRREVEAVRATSDGETFLPFWKTRVECTGELRFDTQGAFEKLAGQPPRKRTSPDAPMVFFAPAFKIQPRAFLRLCTRLTIAQAAFDTVAQMPRERAHPITLSSSEAAEAVVLTVASLTFAKRDLFAAISQLGARVIDQSVVYLPFRTAGAELIQPHLNLSLEAAALQFSADI